MLWSISIRDMILRVVKYHIVGKKVSIMNEKDKKGRVQNMIDGILDAAVKELEGLGVEAVSVVIREVKE